MPASSTSLHEGLSEPQRPVTMEMRHHGCVAATQEAFLAALAAIRRCCDSATDASKKGELCGLPAYFSPDGRTRRPPGLPMSRGGVRGATGTAPAPLWSGLGPEWPIRSRFHGNANYGQDRGQF